MPAHRLLRNLLLSLVTLAGTLGLICNACCDDASISTPCDGAGDFGVTEANSSSATRTRYFESSAWEKWAAGEASCFQPCLDDEGLHFSSRGDRLKFTNRGLLQFEGVGISKSNENSPGGFRFPRVRQYFIFDIDEWINFTTIIQTAYAGLGPLNNWKVLDIWLELKLCPQLRVRGGHFRSPFLYELHLLGEEKLITPERSVYNNTVTTERQTGLMFLGDLLDDRLFYAMGIFYGPSHVFYDTNRAKDFIGMVDAKPFRLREGHPLQHLHLVYSLDFGVQDAQPPLAQAYRIQSEMDARGFIAGSSTVSPVWLLFDAQAAERGGRVETAFETVWFYKSFTLLASVQGGYRRFALNNSAPSRVPFAGFQVSTTYFLTGEAFTNRDEIRPLRDFQWRSPFSNPGAWEVFARYAQLDVGRELVDQGIAQAPVSTHAVQTIDVGTTWYLNNNSTFYIDWQKSIFASPVEVGPAAFSKGYDLFLLRYQYLY